MLIIMLVGPDKSSLCSKYLGNLLLCAFSQVKRDSHKNYKKNRKFANLYAGCDLFPIKNTKTGCTTVQWRASKQIILQIRQNYFHQIVILLQNYAKLFLSTFANYTMQFNRNQWIQLQLFLFLKLISGVSFCLLYVCTGKDFN